MQLYHVAKYKNSQTMTFLEQLNRLKRLHYFISIGGTGKPSECAKRLDVSRTSFFRYLEDLRCLGAEIKYCSDRQSYYYLKPPSEVVFK